MSHIGVNLGFGNLHEKLTDEQMYAGELELAERLGYDSLWAVEHHFDDYAMCPDNVVLLANIAGRTERMMLGTAAVILPWNDPLRVAEKMIMLDILSGGRAIFGMGRGLSRMEYAPFGIDMSESRARFDEAAAMIVAALETGWIEGDGRYYPRPRTQLRPSPPRSFRGRLYCVAGSPDSVSTCVSVGASLLAIVTAPVPTLMPVFDSYRDQWRAAHDTEAPPIALNMNMYCHADAEIARERALTYIQRFFASNVRHYEFMGTHFKEISGYERYDEVAALFRQAGLEGAANAYAACALTGTPDQIVANLTGIKRSWAGSSSPFCPASVRCHTTRPKRAWSCSPRRSCRLRGTSWTKGGDIVAKLGVPAVSVLTQHNVPVVARDGTQLRADVHRAVEGGPFPVLLIRNPYGEQLMRAAAPVIPAIDAGFAVVVQHCRGTGTSDGEFVTFENEAADGADAIDWCARQPWCDGSVAMLGPSYLGMAQLAAATTAPRPSALKGMVLIVTPADYHWGLAYRQGAFQLGQLLGWHLLKSGQELAYRAAAGLDVLADLPALGGLAADPAAGYRHLPLRDMPAVSGMLPSWQRWLEHEERDAYWTGLSYRDARDRVAAPALHVGGWFDLFLGGTLDNFTTLSRHAALAVLASGGWPGNIRGLRQALTTALVRSLSGDITVDDLPEDLAGGGRGRRLTRLEWHERQALVTALRDAAGDREAAARELGISRATIYRKLKRHGIRLPAAPRQAHGRQR